MGYKIPTYEEYKKATQFARFRYVYGNVITTIAIILFILLLLFIFLYSEELSQHPMNYVAKKNNINYCNCLTTDGKLIMFNSSAILIQENPIPINLL